MLAIETRGNRKYGNHEVSNKIYFIVFIKLIYNKNKYINNLMTRTVTRLNILTMVPELGTLLFINNTYINNGSPN